MPRLVLYGVRSSCTRKNKETRGETGVFTCRYRSRFAIGHALQVHTQA